MILSLDQAKKNYGKFELDCSLQVKEGQVTGLVGQNGAGKSTTFKLILGLIHLDGGSIELFGKNISELGKKEREKIGVVLSDSGFSGYLRIKDLLPVLDGMYTDFDRQRFMELCDKFKLPMDKKIKEFSTGMKAKLKILVAISHKARLLILDEPTAGLDVIARGELLDMLRDYMERENGSILISSHISSDLEGLCDDIYMINEGKILLHEDTDVLLSDYAVLKVTDSQYEKLEKQYLFKVKKETFGYSCLTNERQFYLEKYPEVTIEKGNIDEVITMMLSENIKAD